ncbi:hypothetical protein DITRI_Ditri16bG0151700 [Diplodiscus trichospermus]
MGGQNFVVNGGVKMPIGFRFHPTDEELVVHYLKRKALCLPLPASVIPEFDVFQTDPWSLPGSGYWKPIGKEKPILASGSNQVVGMRKALIFCQRKRSDETKTRWLLHQYRLAEAQMSTRELHGDWVVFRVFQRNRQAKRHGVVSNKSETIDFTVEDCSVFGPPQPASPCSSEITEVCSIGRDQEESSGFVTSSSSNCSMRKQ